jgi:hypothetical protein
MAAAATLAVAGRFCGPPGAGNGGYVAGLLAAALGHDGPVEVTLRRPVPLDRALRVEGGRLLDRDGAPLAEARAAAAEALPSAPRPPGPEAAAAMSRRFIGFRAHGVRGCFVCGTSRAEGDGLRIFPGAAEPTDAERRVAAPWMPDASLAGPEGAVRPEFVWAALDCPGAFALMEGQRAEAMLLGRITARLAGRVHPGERCVVVGWPLGAEGRKRFAGTAVFGADGALRGLARAVWFTPQGAAG